MWNIASGVNNNDLKNILIELNKIKPGLVRSTFDCYNILHWNGGYPMRMVPKITPYEFIKRVKKLNNNGIGVSYTFSNYYIKEKDLDDKWCNYFLENSHTPLNGISCTSEILLKYIRKNYPKFKMTASTTHLNNSLDYLKQLQDKYDFVVLPSDVNRNYEVIKQLDVSRVEILVSTACTPNCKVKNLHYELNNKWNYSHDIDDLQAYLKFKNSQDHCWEIRKTKRTGINLIKKYELEELKSLGIKHFKLQDRADFLTTVMNIFQFAIFYSNEPLGTKMKLFNKLPRKAVIKNYNRFVKKRYLL